MVDWAKADWKLNDYQLAKLLGCTRETVRDKRKKLGILPVGKRGYPLNRGKRKMIEDLDYEWPSKIKSTSPSQRFKNGAHKIWGEACEICSYIRFGVSNHVHHIISRANGGKHTFRNVCILCSRCHDEVHAGMLELPMSLLEKRL